MVSGSATGGNSAEGGGSGEGICTGSDGSAAGAEGNSTGGGCSEELKVPPLDQVVAHLEVEVEVRRLPRLREARLELAPVANALRQEWRLNHR